MLKRYHGAVWPMDLTRCFPLGPLIYFQTSCRLAIILFKQQRLVIQGYNSSHTIFSIHLIHNSGLPLIERRTNERVKVSV